MAQSCCNRRTLDGCLWHSTDVRNQKGSFDYRESRFRYPYTPITHRSISLLCPAHARSHEEDSVAPTIRSLGIFPSMGNRIHKRGFYASLTMAVFELPFFLVFEYFVGDHTRSELIFLSHRSYFIKAEILLQRNPNKHRLRLVHNRDQVL